MGRPPGLSSSLQAVREAIEITRLVWSGESITYQGKHWQLTNVKLPFAARKDIPIWIATRGQKFKLAGELANGVVTHGKATNYLKR